MDVWIEFTDTGKDAHITMDCVPRAGEIVLWLDSVIEDGTEYDHDVEYVVESVDWTLNKRDDEPGHARLRLRPSGPDEGVTPL
ncbi:hypothetical protein [Streptomyces scopuliridis]|uniref:Uncharacterized protein n=1 Tax=Streptomyces scopuliridis RB72 TaxID=1440053 RepID=A0A2T7SP83_9ACTN|nr:hypothetical protein [Streptomyces scopuliridis]PVE04679.1 hypothetical protein Y717_10815 [Streptomyces scopuliridis RB72]